MQAHTYLRPLLATAVALLSIAGCSDETRSIEENNTQSDAGPQRFKPAPNGVRMPENDACNALLNARESKTLALQCIITAPACPSLLRADYPTACLEYDQGSVNGCTAYYNAATTCDDLKARIADCLVSAYPGSEPAGCP